MPSDIVTRFKEKYENLAGHVHLCKSEGEAVARVAEICADSGAGRVAVGEFADGLGEPVTIGLGSAGLDVYGPDFLASDLPEGIDRAAVGVSGPAFVIAESGTLVEFATNDAYRLVSTLPRVHVGVFREQDIIDTLRESGPRVKAYFDENPRNATVTFISGPSRTADIEMKLTLGVHGPEVTHAVVIIDRAGEDG